MRLHMTSKNKKRNRFKTSAASRQKLLSELKARYPNYIFKSNLLGALFLAGLVLTILEINIYRVTLISIYIPLSIWLLTGIIVVPFFKRIFDIYCFNPYSPGRTPIFFHYLFNIVSFGGIVVFLFMWSNLTFNDKSKSVLTLPIVSYGHLAKSRENCGKPYVHIYYKGGEKELVFPCGTDVEKFNSVYVEIAKGLFGFDVITNKTLIQGVW
jgi:hypothetical protein